MVEGTVGVISTFILGALRNRRFLSLNELNEGILERLHIFNHKLFQKRDGSRAAAFEEEKTSLLPFSPRPFELAIWKVATVVPNYHISVDKQNYSAPYEYIKQKVDIRVTKATVEVFFGGNRICSHRRLYGRPNQYSMIPQIFGFVNAQSIRNCPHNFAGTTAQLARNHCTTPAMSPLSVDGICKYFTCIGCEYQKILDCHVDIGGMS